MINKLQNNAVSLSAIIALSESLLVVEVSSEGGGSADIDQAVSAKHVSRSLLFERDELSPPSWPIAVASLVHRPSRKSRKARAAYLPPILHAHFLCNLSIEELLKKKEK